MDLKWTEEISTFILTGQNKNQTSFLLTTEYQIFETLSQNVYSIKICTKFNFTKNKAVYVFMEEYIFKQIKRPRILCDTVNWTLSVKTFGLNLLTTSSERIQSFKILKWNKKTYHPFTFHIRTLEKSVSCDFLGVRCK